MNEIARRVVAGRNSFEKFAVIAVGNSNKDMGYIHSSNRIIKRLERYKWLFYPIVIASGGLTELELRFLKLFRKKIIYLMHGCLWYETKVNNLTTSEKALKNEDLLLSTSTAIICVSERYSEWVKKEYPQYSHKIKFVNNGITLNQRPFRQKEQYSIAVSGGNRLQKNNGIICKAVEKLNSSHYILPPVNYSLTTKNLIAN